MSQNSVSRSLSNGDYWFTAAQKAAQLILSLAPKAGVQIEDNRDNGFNANYDQLEQGLVLEISNGIPCSIYTPLGSYRFAGVCTVSHAARSKYMGLLFNCSELRIGLYAPRFDSKKGCSEWYTIEAVNQFELPEAISLTETLWDADAAEVEWDTLNRRFLHRHCLWDNFVAQVKSNPRSFDARLLSNQWVWTVEQHQDGFVSVMPTDTLGKGGVATRISLSDLKVFESKLVQF